MFDHCRALCLVLEPNLANQIAARVTLVDKNGVKDPLEDGEGGGALYHGYVEGEEGEGQVPWKVKLFIGPCLGLYIVLPLCKNGSGYGLQ